MAAPSGPEPQTPATGSAGTPHLEAVLLHFLANLRMAGDVSGELAAMGLGRIHNRILGIALGSPGITVGQLVRILSVTHQNIRVPMKTLIERGLLVSEVDDVDRRTRRLSVTEPGRELVASLLSRQAPRLERAFAEAGPDAVEGFIRVHELLLDPDDAPFIDHIRETIGSRPSPPDETRPHPRSR